MNDTDIKSITKVLDEKFKPLHGELARIRTEIGKDIARIDNSLESIKETLDKHTKTLDKHTGILDDHTKLLKSHDKNINKVLWDQMLRLTAGLDDVKEILKNNTMVLKEKVEKGSEDTRKLNKRVIVTESHLGIVSPPELTII